MMNDDDRQVRSGPPKDQDDWIYFWTGVHKSHETWRVTAPFVALVRNWKAVVAVVAVVAWLNKPGIWGALQTLMGGAP
jgi:hypothetical protein